MIVIFAVIVGGVRAEETVTSKKEISDTLVGIIYFAGWWEELPNKWQTPSSEVEKPDWRSIFPERVPLLGDYNVQQTMDREIIAAADHGVDFFSILWYYPQLGRELEESAKKLNRGLETYLASPNAGRMKFFIEYCNASGLNATNENEWNECVNTWVTAMKHSSYLRIDGRLVFKIHDVTLFSQVNNNDLELCKIRLDTLRKAVRTAGLGEMVMGVGITGETPPLLASWPPTPLFDFTATYMSVPQIEASEHAYPYKKLTEHINTTPKNRVSDPLPWMPFLAAGWNPKPWTYPTAPPHYQVFFELPTREEFTKELDRMKNVLRQYPSLGIPRKDGTNQKIFTIYAWNEFGEGGIIAPTKSKGFMMLECIKDVFGIK